MRIACVGGGPAGLFLALLLRRADRRNVVHVYDRNPPGASYGFGVVFSRLSLARLYGIAPDVISAVLAQGVRWDGVEVRVDGRSARSGGHGYAAVGRQALLRVLAAQAAQAGASVCWERPADAWTLCGSYDVVVAADGAQSGTRNSRPGEFGARTEQGRTRYAWFGADRAVEMMTFSFVRGQHGLLAAHMYPYAPDASTVLVELTPATWRAAGFRDYPGRQAGWTDQRALAYCQEALGDELAGARLLGNGSRWLALPQVRTCRWSADRVVLVGDAAHTTHFSIGSGTTLALEDAAELARCLTHSPDAGSALAAYAAARQPVVRAMQHTAWASRQIWEQPDEHAAAGPGPLLFRLLTRAGQVTTDLLLRSDPRLPEAVGQPLSADPPPESVVRAGFSADLVSGGPVAAIVRPVELPRVAPRAGSLSAIAVTAGGAEAVSCVRALRGGMPGVPVGGYAAVCEGGGEAVSSAVSRLSRLHRESPLDFVAVGRGADAARGVRLTQMVTCQVLRSWLGLPVSYVCPPAEVRHGWTHVQAGRADQIWLIPGDGERA